MAPLSETEFLKFFCNQIATRLVEPTKFVSFNALFCNLQIKQNNFVQLSIDWINIHFYNYKDEYNALHEQYTKLVIKKMHDFRPSVLKLSTFFRLQDKTYKTNLKIHKNTTVQPSHTIGQNIHLRIFYISECHL